MKNYNWKEKILSYGHNMDFFTMMKEFLNYVEKLKFDKGQIDRFTFDNFIEYNTINKVGDALYLEIEQ